MPKKKRKFTIRCRLGRLSAAALIMSVLWPVLIQAFPQLPGRQRRPDIRPQIPQADRNSGQRVFIEHADVMEKLNDTFIILRGDVRFSKGAMLMFCDSAHYYPDTESMDAFSNVRMEQGDTLFIYADELNYNGPDEIAYLYANGMDSVRLINRDVMLKTPVFVYDLGIDLGYYNVGGALTDAKNRLTSVEGEYVPSTKEANFYRNVHLNARGEKDTLDIYTDTLYYNTDTHITELFSPSMVVNAKATIFTTNGTYNTETNIADLYDRSMVKTSNNNTIVGDTLFYDRNLGYGEAWGNMVLVDSAKCTSLSGDYGFYNERTDSSYVTGHALAMEYSRPDTLYLHGRQIQTFRLFDTVRVEAADSDAVASAIVRIDTTNVLVAYPRVRFYRNDMQGLCDSMRFESRDTTLYMHIHPIVWSGERQIFGKEIQVHLNDSTIDWARLPQSAFTAEHIAEEFYQQLSGKEMIAYFTGGEISHLDVSGNVMAIYLPMENDSTYNKIFNIESSFLSADFADREMLRMKLWPENTTTGTPLFMAKKSLYYLPGFKWYEHLRPTSPLDVFNIPAGMDELLNTQEEVPGAPRRKTKKSQTPAMPQLSDVNAEAQTTRVEDNVDPPLTNDNPPIEQ